MTDKCKKHTVMCSSILFCLNDSIKPKDIEFYYYMNLRKTADSQRGEPKTRGFTQRHTKIRINYQNSHWLILCQSTYWLISSAQLPRYKSVISFLEMDYWSCHPKWSSVKTNVGKVKMLLEGQLGTDIRFFSDLKSAQIYTLINQVKWLNKLIGLHLSICRVWSNVACVSRVLVFSHLLKNLCGNAGI